MTKIKFLDGAEGKFSSDKKWSNIKVKKIKNPNWTRDEIILALDFYHKNFHLYLQFHDLINGY